MEKRNNIISVILTVFFFAVNAVFFYMILSSGFLPQKYILPLALVLLLFSAVVPLLSFKKKKSTGLIISVVFVLLVTAAEITAMYVLCKGKSALENITKPEEEYTEVCIYVRNDDVYRNIDDIKGLKIGILSFQGRKNVDSAIKELPFNTDGLLKEYNNIEDLMDALLKSKEVDSILIDDVFLVLLEDIEAHKDDISKIDKIYSAKVVIEKETSSVSTTAKQATETTLESETQGEPITPPEPPKDDVMTVYISGIDCNGSINRVSRSDVNIIATINFTTGQMLLVSTPRDFFVPLSISNGIRDKLTHAGIYGIDVSRDTLGMLYDIDIDYYFRVNFDGFQGIIDALGGVRVNSPADFSAGGFNFTKGYNDLNGKQALAFSRERYSFAGGDRQRGKNQMEVIRALTDKLTSTSLIKNFISIMDSLSGTFMTDIPYEKITEIVQRQIAEGKSWNVTTCSADGTGDFAQPYSQSTQAYVMWPDEQTVENAKNLMSVVRNGGVPIQ